MDENVADHLIARKLPSIYNALVCNLVANSETAPIGDTWTAAIKSLTRIKLQMRWAGWRQGRSFPGNPSTSHSRGQERNTFFVIIRRLGKSRQNPKPYISGGGKSLKTCVIQSYSRQNKGYRKVQIVRTHALSMSLRWTGNSTVSECKITFFSIGNSNNHQFLTHGTRLD